MTSINLSDLCYALDGYTVVLCSEYKAKVKHSKHVVAVTFISLGGIFVFGCFVTWVYKKWSSHRSAMKLRRRMIDIESPMPHSNNKDIDEGSYSTCEDET